LAGRGVHGLPVERGLHEPPLVHGLRILIDENIPFGEEAFAKALKATGRTHLVVGGIMTHICVCQTVLDALHHGYIVHLAEDAVSCWKRTDHAAGLEKMRKAGASIESSEIVVYEWLDRAGTPEFKAALPILKG
jgi:nicotinamidase-related amidase